MQPNSDPITVIAGNRSRAIIEYITNSVNGEGIFSNGNYRFIFPDNTDVPEFLRGREYEGETETEEIEEVNSVPKLYKGLMPVKFGVELTYRLKENLVEFFPNYDEILLNFYRKVGIEYYKHHMDGGSDLGASHAELPTDIIKPEETKDFINKFDNLLKLLDKTNIFMPSSKNIMREYSREGGGHIHMDVEFLERDFINKFHRNIRTFHLNNPWISWTFQNPYDNYSSCLQRFEDDFGNMSNYTWSTVDYQEDLDTFEFRYFMMPRTTKELKLHLKLAGKIYKYCYSLTAEGHDIKDNKIDFEKVKLTDSLNGLKKTMQLLKIPYQELVECGKISILKKRYKNHNPNDEPYLDKDVNISKDNWFMLR